MRLTVMIYAAFVFIFAQPSFSQQAAAPPQSFPSALNTCQPGGNLGSHKVDCEAVCPTGSRIVLGSCNVVGNRPWALYNAFKADDRTWKCSAYDPLLIGNPKSIRLKAQADCQSLASSPSVTWKTVASNTIAIARSGTYLNTTIQQSFMVCNTNGPDAMTAFIYQRTVTPPGFKVVTPNPVIARGKCLLVDQPTALFVVDYVSVNRDDNGFYRTFPPGTFDLGGASYKIINVDSELIPSTPSMPMQVEAPCTRVVPDPNPTQNIYSTCPIPGLVENASYRVCFPAMYTPPMNNGDPYSGTLVLMVVDPSLTMKPYPSSNPDEVLYNPIIPGGCRDLYNISSASFIVTPWARIPPDTVWDPTRVTKVMMTVEKL
jgi:hypothetical protein